MKGFLKRIKKELYWLPRNLTGDLVWIFVRNKKVMDLRMFERRFFSQNGEDGILRYIFHEIGETNQFFVEFGVGDGKICNTRYLSRKGWRGVQIDCKSVSPQIKEKMITAENINDVFSKYDVPQKPDLVSIDIDGNDYWVWKALNYKPRVVVIEYNATIPINESKTVVYDPSLTWDRTNYFGASIKALKNLGEEKGYVLLTCDSQGVNSFFVREDLSDRFEIRDLKDIYRPLNFASHHPSKRKMIEV